MAYPTRRPARPNAFEKVRRTTRFGYRAEQRDAVDRGRVRHELAVGLVEQHEHGVRDLRHEGVEVRGGDDRAGGVVGSADQDDAGAIRDRRGHRIQVVVGAGAERHPHARRARDGDETRVRLEGTPGVEDLVSGSGGRLDQLLEDRHRTGSDLDLVVGDSEPFGEPCTQHCGRAVGVAVDARLGDGLEHGGERRERVLVRGQLERIRAAPACPGDRAGGRRSRGGASRPCRTA